MTEILFSVALFVIGMTAAIVRKNVVMTILSLMFSNLALIILLKNSVVMNLSSTEYIVIYYAILALACFTTCGLLAVSMYFKSNKTIMNEEMKIWPK